MQQHKQCSSSNSLHRQCSSSSNAAAAAAAAAARRQQLHSSSSNATAAARRQKQLPLTAVRIKLYLSHLHLSRRCSRSPSRRCHQPHRRLHGRQRPRRQNNWRMKTGFDLILKVHLCHRLCQRRLCPHRYQQYVPHQSRPNSQQLHRAQRSHCRFTVDTRTSELVIGCYLCTMVGPNIEMFWCRG